VRDILPFMDFRPSLGAGIRRMPESVFIA